MKSNKIRTTIHKGKFGNTIKVIEYLSYPHNVQGWFNAVVISK